MRGAKKHHPLGFKQHPLEDVGTFISVEALQNWDSSLVFSYKIEFFRWIISWIEKDSPKLVVNFIGDEFDGMVQSVQKSPNI